MLNNHTKIPTRIALVDDEASCLIDLRSRIETSFPELEIVFEAASLEETREALKTHAIDLIFLDVQLKDGNAFDLLGNLNENTRVIFTTGYDSFAVRAFEVNALDYLLKPVQNDRLARAIQVFSDQSKRNKTLPLIRPDDDILLQENGVTRFVPISELIYVKSEKDYTQVHTTTRSWFIRRAIGAWEQQLPVTLFLRVHRSYLINTQHIESVKKDSAGRYRIYLKNEAEPIVSSRRYGMRLRRVFGNEL